VSRRRSTSKYEGCLVAFLIAGVIGGTVKAFQVAPVLSASIAVFVVALCVVWARSSSEKNRIRRQQAKDRQAQRRQRALRQAQQDTEDGVLFKLGDWRITPKYLIEGPDVDSKRHKMASLTASFDSQGYLIITGPSVELLQEIRQTKTSFDQAQRTVRKLNKLMRAAEKVSGLPDRDRPVEAFTDCPVGHYGYHSLIPVAGDSGKILRRCIEDGCQRSWTERA
jgi:hypothetical protein